jgi:hypothetical protein
MMKLQTNRQLFLQNLQFSVIYITNFGEYVHINWYISAEFLILRLGCPLWERTYYPSSDSIPNVIRGNSIYGTDIAP